MNDTAVTVRGHWPGIVILRSGWWKGFGRPLHDDSPDAVLRVDRASAEFVRRSAHTLTDLGAGAVFSPPMMRGSDRVFRAAGFQPNRQLLLLERDLRREIAPNQGPSLSSSDDLIAAARIDAVAFEDDWRVGRLGLVDALDATPHSTLLMVEGGAGFAIVGVSAEVGYLQRIAVDPSRQGRGVGRSLLRGAMTWARGRGARTMLLNTQTDNEKATHMYRSESFVVLPSRLTIHRFEP
jgi:[ribosomal protein S18]-alanine N-acetyltransferase